jgi:serine/threonine protein phosphatase 1
MINSYYNKIMKTITQPQIVAIGDVHGHYNQLQELLEILTHEYDISFHDDTFVFLGDNVDGGPDTKKVIDYLISAKKGFPHWHFLYGNHEDLMLDALNPKHPVYGDYYIWWNQGGKETTDSYVREAHLNAYERSLVNPIHVIPPEHFKFFNSLETYWETEDYFFVHGGVHPSNTIEWTKENWDRYKMIWERSFIGSNMKYEKKIIFGHTIRTSHNPKNHLMPWIFPNMIGIDTFAHNQGRLTAVILPDETIVQTKYYSSQDIENGL